MRKPLVSGVGLVSLALLVILGWPRSDMRASAQDQKSASKATLPVFEVDERYTSVEAEAEGAHDVDAAAAALILEQFFREHP